MNNYLKDKLKNNDRLNKNDIVMLFESNDIFDLAEMSSERAKKLHGNKVYYTKNFHINPTNICINRCKFCAFSRSKGENGAYELTITDIMAKLHTFDVSSNELIFKEIHIVGGLHPEWPFEHYLELISTIKKQYPNTTIKAFTAVEIDHLSKINKKTIEETLKILQSCGLEMMPGGGAEIFSPQIRKNLCPEKISGERWLEIHEIAHSIGIKTNATMLYGHIESYEDRAEHLLMLRQLQDKTSGFMAFIPLSFQRENNSLGGLSTSGIDDLKTIAVSRLALDNFAHIKAYWIMLSEKISQIALLFGADDIDGTIMEEKIAHSAGASSSTMLTVEELQRSIINAGKIPTERDSFYRTAN
ncbi:radical SAM domain-containing protein [Candidatus Magnetoovum chiemensis]|nr:radical SAM domain-containing protein [Candidatus Magnetoovum chiemensis]